MPLLLSVVVAIIIIITIDNNCFVFEQPNEKYVNNTSNKLEKSKQLKRDS